MNVKRIADTAILVYLAWNAIDRTIEAKKYFRPTELDLAEEKWQTAYREEQLYRRKLKKNYGKKRIEALAELLRLRVESEKAFNEYQWRKGMKADKGKREKMRKEHMEEEEKRA